MKSFFKFLLSITCLLFSQSLFSQQILVENFEGTFPTTGWSFQALSGNNWSQSPSNNAVSGSKSLRCLSAPFAPGNAWAFMPSLSLQPSTAYRLSFYYKGVTNPYANPVEKIKVTIGQGNTIAAQVNTLHDYPNIVNTSFLQGIDTFTVSTAGNYNIAFHYYSTANQGTGYIDSVILQQLLPAPCSSAPVIGTASAPGMVAAGSTFTLSLSGSYLLTSGLSFQWQRRAAGTGNFQDIPGAGSSVFNLTQNHSSDYRCMVTCINGGASTLSNVVSVFVSGSGPQFRDKYIGDPNINKHIQGMSFLTPATGFVAFNSAVGFTQDTGQTFQQRPVSNGNTNFNGYSVNITFGFSCTGVHAFSTDSLLLYGDYGAEPAILFSANGGLSWKLVFHQGFNGDVANSLLDMKFQSNNLGVAISQKFIMESTNRGQNWLVKHQVPSYRSSIFSKISMPAQTLGYVAGGTAIYKRWASGGWFEMSTTGLPGNIGYQYNQVSFITERVGYLVRDDAYTIYKTLDGGTNWLPTNNPAFSSIAASDIHFINDSTGLATTPYTYNVLKTSNSGRTWEVCKRNSAYQYGNYGMNRLFFLDKNFGWAGGRGEFLMFTSTAGNPTMPKAFITIDTMAVSINGLVKVTGSYDYYQHKWFRNGVIFSTSSSASYTHDIFEGRDTLTLIVSNGTDSDTLLQYQDYHPYSQVPVISSFTPNAAAANNIVNIIGIGFNNTIKVSFGGIEARSFVVNSNSSITAKVAGGSSGHIAVTTSNGTGEAIGFNFELPAAPVITSFTPEYGPVGTTVSIDGNNFNPIASANIIYFGKIKATVISATANHVICIVPAGASFDPISISNMSNNLSSYASKPFNITFSGNAAITVNSFYNVLNIPCVRLNGIQPIPIYATSGDMDGDGKNDIISTIVRGAGDSIYIFKNNSIRNHISFEPKVPITTGEWKTSIGIGDIDNDGKPDLIKIRGHGVSVLRNRGGLNFAPPVDVPGPGGPEEIVIRDLDADGRPEIIIAGYNESRMCVLRNVTVDSTINFAPKLEFPTGGIGSRTIAAGDLDGDNKPDVIMSKNGGFSIFKNTSHLENISFNSKMDFTTSAEVSKIFVSDVDLDSKPDITIVYNTTTTSFSIYKNTSSEGSISFQPKIDFLSSGYDYSEVAEMHNFTGDSLPDLLTGNGYYYTSYLNKNISTTTDGIQFYPAIGLPTGTTASLCATDLDGDGKVDFVSLDDANTINTFHFFRNRIGEPVDKIGCVSLANYPTYLGSNLTGTTYQWQSDTGTGFTNIADNANYSGAYTNVLSIQTGASSWYGYKYRCVVDGNYSDVFILKFQNTWTGTINSAWENPGNWDCGHVPGENEDVVIASGNVVIQSNAVIRSLFAGAGSDVLVATGYTFTILH